jgi:hypothetical protein
MRNKDDARLCHSRRTKCDRESRGKNNIVLDSRVRGNDNPDISALNFVWIASLRSQ